MMGRHAKQNELWSEPVNLAKRIPPDHPLRKLKSVLNLDFVRQEVAGCYGTKGNVSVDPVLIIKMMLLLFWDDLKSERELMRVIPLRIDYLWFLGYGLEDEVPNHSVLSKARKRWGVEVFERVFSRSVQQCLDAGLIDGAKLYADSSLVRADASLNSVVRLTLNKLDEPVLAETKTEATRRIPTNQSHVVTTDRYSALVRHKSGKALPSYKNHRALDAKVGVITATHTTSGIRADGVELVALVESHQAQTGMKPKAVVADSAYGTTENFLTLGKRGIRTHMADLRGRQHNHHLAEIFPTEKFRYDPQKDTCHCPAGKELTWHHLHHQRGYHEYRSGKGVCQKCPLVSQCTRSKTGRTINRYPDQEILDRARRQSHGPAARRDRKRRQWLQEGKFGEAATQHGYKRSRWRGLWKQTVQDNLIAALQNFKILLRHLPKGLFWFQNRLQDLLARLLEDWTESLSRFARIIPAF